MVLVRNAIEFMNVGNTKTVRYPGSLHELRTLNDYLVPQFFFEANPAVWDEVFVTRYR